MGLFSAPKCPRCGGPLEATGYSIGHPTHRCWNCIETHRRENKLEDRIAALEAEIATPNPERKQQ